VVYDVSLPLPPPLSRHHGVFLVVRFAPSSVAAAEPAIGHMTGGHPAIMQATSTAEAVPDVRWTTPNSATRDSNSVGKRWTHNSISTMLGGRPYGNQGKARECPNNRDVLNAVLDFAEASQKFRTREAEGSRISNLRRPGCKTGVPLNCSTPFSYTVRTAHVFLRIAHPAPTDLGDALLRL
jgi:hypothetical protein